MIYRIIHLKDIFPFLGEQNADPTLAAYLPDNLSEMGRDDWRRPCLLICPGGGYVMCSQRESEPIALRFLPEGYNVFVLTYSVAPHCFPTQLREVAAAMELIYSSAAQWHCDTERIAIMGFSAGGHLAAHYSTSYDCPEVRERFPQSKGVQAAILGYPVITANPQFAHMGSFESLLGHSPLTGEETARFSCEKRVTAHTPPTFLWHTAPDDCVPVMNSLLYAQALAEHGVPFAMRIYPCGGHGLATVDTQTNSPLEPSVAIASEWIAEAKQWLKITLADANS